MTSVPAPGSVRTKAPRCLPVARGTRYFFFCSSVPKRLISMQAIPTWIDTVNPVEEHDRESSSTTMALVR
ncbi:MAG: hypothetical protein A4E67_02383 [Syntrophaceae bacterium PtaB.Bin038]|nr:MAG: hypothetical protein A4E67_02383 [Syntrophaceae bacterium PtaB.Bin038]